MHMCAWQPRAPLADSNTRGSVTGYASGSYIHLHTFAKHIWWCRQAGSLACLEIWRTPIAVCQASRAAPVMTSTAPARGPFAPINKSRCLKLISMYGHQLFCCEQHTQGESKSQQHLGAMPHQYSVVTSRTRRLPQHNLVHSRYREQ